MLRILPRLALIVLLAGGCGRVASRVVHSPDNLGVIKEVALLPVDVRSKEETEEAASFNAQWKKMADEEVRAALTAAGIEVGRRSKYKVACRVEAIYGNRTLRHLVGPDAGGGRITVTVELRDARGKVRYATRAETDLSAGLGGGVAGVVRNTIRAAAGDFAIRL